MLPGSFMIGRVDGCSVSQWIGSNLEVDHFRVRPFSRLAVEWRARAPGGPHALPLPAGLGIVEASIHPFGIETHRIRHPQYGELAIHQGDQRVRGIAGNDRRVLAQPQRIELIDPDVVVRVGAAGSRDVLELRPRRLIKRPSFRALPSCCFRPVQRTSALVRSKLARCPLASATQTTPLPSMSIPRGEKPHTGALGSCHGTS